MSRIDQLEQHLFLMGYTNADVQVFIDHYVEADDDERERLWALGDAKLRVEMRTLRERAEAELPPAEPPAAAMTEGWAFDVAEITGRSGKDVIAWVDGDPQRARFALEYEQSFSDPRKTVLRALGKLAEF